MIKLSTVKALYKQQFKPYYISIRDLKRKYHGLSENIAYCAIRVNVREVCAIIEQEKTSQGWQPIETAPKDRTPVLLCGDKDFMTAYPAIFVRPPLDEYPHWQIYMSGKNFEQCLYTPTHWQPLPEPFKEGE